MEYLLKDYLKKANNKEVMNLNLWGQVKDNNEYIFNMLRLLYNKTGSCIVSICHEKEMMNEENPQFNKLIPSLMTSSALSVCAKASYVFYCKIEEDTVIEELKEKDSDLLKALYLLAFSTYEGFDNF